MTRSEGCEQPTTDEIAYGGDEPHGIERLGKVGLVAGVERHRSILGARECRQRNRRQPLGRVAAVAHATNQIVAILPRHADVADQQLRVEVGELIQRRVDVGDRHHIRFGILQDAVHQRAGVGVILDDQHAAAAQAGGLACDIGWRWLCLAMLGTRQRDGERRAEALARAGDGNRSAVRFDQLFDDCQSQAEPAVPTLGAGMFLPEPVEDVRQELGGDAAARVRTDRLICDSDWRSVM